jgi:hypothetical protein
MLRNVLLVLDEFVSNELLGVGGARSQLRQAIDHVAKQVKAVHVIDHYHIEWRRGGAFYLVAAHVQVLVVRAALG